MKPEVAESIENQEVSTILEVLAHLTPSVELIGTALFLVELFGTVSFYALPSEE